MRKGMIRHSAVRVLTLVSALLLSATAGAFVVSTGDIELGKWNANFQQGMVYAETYNVPMVLFYASPTCSNCETLKGALDDPAVYAWAESRQMVMIQDTGGTDALEFARNNSRAFPYICIYWPKADGTAATNRFSGLNQKMPATSGSLAQQFMDSCDLFTADWKGVYKGAGFKVFGSEGNRLEAVVGGPVGFVDVPVVRSGVFSQTSATNYLIGTFPGVAVPVTNRLDWQVGESAKTSRLVFPRELTAAVGQTIRLELADDTGAEHRESAVTFVEEPSSDSSTNPKWLGETFAFGTWTMDYAAATNAVAQAKASGTPAYMLVLYTGALWCPYCKGIEGSLLADARFYDWARENNVALVEFDQGRASSPATAAGTLAPRLLTYEPDPNLDAANTVSGAGYISRHGVEPEDAQRMLALTTEFTQKWRAPEATAARLSQPTLLLVDGDRVVARFAAQRNDDRVYDTVENIGRLNDFLKLAEGDGELDGYRTTTRLRHAMGGSETVTMQISDRTKFYALDEVGAGRLEFVRELGCSEDLTFTLMQGKNTLAIGTNTLIFAISGEVAEAGDLKLKVGAYSNTSALFFNRAEPVETTEFAAAFASQLVLLPEERLSHCPRAGEHRIAVRANVTYRFMGFAAESLAGLEVVDAERGLYKATVDETRVMTAETAKAGYQVWNPGDVSFVESSLSVPESETTVMIPVSRTIGGSNKAVVRIELDPVRSALVPMEKYDWTDEELVWEDGETGDRSIPLVVHEDDIPDGDMTLYFRLTILEGEGVSNRVSECAVTILDSDVPATGKLAIVGAKPQIIGKNTVFAEVGSKITLTVKRIGGAEGAATLTITASDYSVPASTVRWTSDDRQAAKTVVVDLSRRSAAMAMRDFTLNLTATGAPVATGSGSLVVKAVPVGAPGFEQAEAAMGWSRNVQSVRYVALTNVVGTQVGLTKLSGTLPPGLSAVANPYSKALEVSGAPTLAGEWTCSYRLWQEVNGTVIQGGTIQLTIGIADDVEEKNPSVATAYTVADIPVYNPSLKRLVGLLTLSIRSTGRLSAKYMSAAGAKSLNASSWESCEDSGLLAAVLTTRDGTYRISVTVDATGGVSGTLVDPTYIYDELSFSSSGHVWSAADPADDWEGLYTMAFVPSRRISGGEIPTPSGCPTLTARLRGSSKATGKMTVVGKLPNGRQVSGSFALSRSADGKSAVMPLFFQSKDDLFSGAGIVAADAAGEYEKHNHRVIEGVADVESCWSHTEKRTETGNFSVGYDLYGSYYDPDEDFGECLRRTEVESTIGINVNTLELAVSKQLGAPGKFPTVGATVDGGAIDCDPTEGFRLSFNRLKGTVSGSAVVTFEKRKMTLSYFGVILPGWTGCGCTEATDLPFILGACWFSDKLYYSTDYMSCTELSEPDKTVTIKRGCSITGDTIATQP